MLIGGKTLVMNHAVGSGQSYGAQSVSAESGMVWWDSTVSRYRGVLCGDLTPHGCEPFEIQWDG
ncbi:hypothetical protein K4G93_23920, partial [Mycobacterium tuberculosis]|nr:hypothetical protein [Mycobacterium tuberculosis]